MASHSNPKQYDPSNTTYVQADPSNFRAVVQRLTGAPPDPFARKLPVTIPTRSHGKTTMINATETGRRLHERRQRGRNLEIKLGSGLPPAMFMVMASPVSPLDVMGMQSPAEEEERSAIAERGFYLHPSPLSNTRSSEPELLTLFPLRSPRDDDPN
ncbi:VQ motif-containing protein 11 [Impatiens glandulifera]|uniref:VQ motif-containing protein 11 n=1 Tax=Impatiens glandulifera TaxID=253017 RepID=UPI001FB159F3|nr:VQ motif-containing protein 11 [Impatiens glandulifera]